MLLVSAEEMRTLDRLTIERHGTPGHVLMERAGQGAARVLLEQFPYVRQRGKRVLVCAGKGNNGGDGFVVARLLARRGIETDVVLLARARDVSGDALRNLKAYRRLGRAVREVTGEAGLGILGEALSRADAVVDAIFGTGLASEVRGVHAAAIELVNTAGVPVLAIDIPSGLDADTGQPLGTAIEAEATATFGFAKVGQVLLPGARLCGTLAVIDIGLAAEAIAAHPPRSELLEADAVARLVPQRSPEAHKGDCGHVLVIAGSFGHTGAAQLASRAALRSGAGLVTLAGPASLYPVYAAGVLEAMTDALPDRDGVIRFDRARLEQIVAGKTTVVVGPGIGTHPDARRVVRWLLTNTRVPLVLDADALTVLALDRSVLRRAAAPVILTPHPGEMARLLGATAASVQGDRVGVARRFAVEHGCTLVLKGARTVVGGPGGAVWINPTGNPGMASGGMGDVLSGILGGLLAQGLDAAEAARLGVYLHGEAADRAAESGGEIGLLASDVIDGLRAGLRALGTRLGS
jgi:hydroxyethylthiazole kinase-like uncharacterized protein yjeF